ncbi:hypothetical protein ACHAWF_008563 [Thalassiosira exigua]
MKSAALTASLGLILATTAPRGTAGAGACRAYCGAPPSLASASAARGPRSPSSFRRPRPGWDLSRRASPSSSLSVPRGGSLDDVDDDDEDELSEEELSNLALDSDEAEDAADSEEEEEEEEEAGGEEDESSRTPAPASGPPVKLVITTGLNSELINRRIEFTASCRQTVLSLRQAASKTMPGRPPLPEVRLKFRGRLLDGEEMVDDILEEMDEDDKEDEDEDEIYDIREEETIKLKLTCNAVPPIDGKFGIELREKMRKVSTKEIVEGERRGDGIRAGVEGAGGGGLGDNKEDEEEGEEEPPYGSSTFAENHSLEIRKRAAAIRTQFEGTLAPDVLRLLDEEDERVKLYEGEGPPPFGLNRPDPSSPRRGRSLAGGATANVRRTLQRNLNVDWADTTRNSLLFLFFGKFGGRNPLSKALLLLGAPLCFLIQTRPAKVAIKRAFYAAGEPPGIVLSLLPAPQQAIASLDYGAAMRRLYEEKELDGEGWLEVEREYGLGGAIGEDSGLYDDYDEDYDDDDVDSDYDSDEEY